MKMILVLLIKRLKIMDLSILKNNLQTKEYSIKRNLHEICKTIKFIGKSIIAI